MVNLFALNPSVLFIATLNNITNERKTAYPPPKFVPHYYNTELFVSLKIDQRRQTHTNCKLP